MFNFLKPDYKRQVLLFTYEDEEGVEHTHKFPAKSIVCSRCNGKGSHDPPAFSDGITHDEFYHEWGPDEREAYLQGQYDVQCTECKGNKITLEVNRDVAIVADEKALAILDSYIKDTHEHNAMVAAERRMGA